MGKKKTHRGAAKRFKVTKSGKIKRRKANRNHILTKKSPKRKRKLRKAKIMSKVDARNIGKIL